MHDAPLEVCARGRPVLFPPARRFRGSRQAPSPPDTPQGRRIAALIAAFETGTPDAIRAFVTANFAASAQKEVPLEQRVQRLGGMAREVGPIAFEQMLPSQAPEIRFLARAKKTGNGSRSA